MLKGFGGPKRDGGPIVAAEERVETFIGSTSSLQGTLKSEGTIRIDGMLEGDIETAGNLIIGKTGRVIAKSISAQNVLIAGAVKGNITAHERLEIVASGRLWGDIRTSSLLIEEGGMFRGQSTMHDELETEPMLLESVTTSNR